MPDVGHNAKIGWIEIHNSFTHSPILDGEGEKGRSEAKHPGKFTYFFAPGRGRLNSIICAQLTGVFCLVI